MRFAKLTQSAVTAKSNTTAMVTLNLDEIAAVAGGDAASADECAFILAVRTLEIAQGQGMFPAHHQLAIHRDREANPT